MLIKLCLDQRELLWEACVYQHNICNIMTASAWTSILERQNSKRNQIRAAKAFFQLKTAPAIIFLQSWPDVMVNQAVVDQELSADTVGGSWLIRVTQSVAGKLLVMAIMYIVAMKWWCKVEKVLFACRCFFWWASTQSCIKLLQLAPCWTNLSFALSKTICDKHSCRCKWMSFASRAYFLAFHAQRRKLQPCSHQCSDPVLENSGNVSFSFWYEVNEHTVYILQLLHWHTVRCTELDFASFLQLRDAW